MKNIYSYFKDSHTGKYLNPLIVDELFFKHLPSNIENDFVLAYGPDYKNICEHRDKKIAKRLAVRINRFKQKLTSLTDQDIYTMDPQELINLFYQKYPQGIYEYFKNPQTKQYLASHVVDELYLNHLPKDDKEDLSLAFGENYLNKIEPINNSYTQFARNRVLIKIFRFRKKLEALTDQDIYTMDPQELINLYYQKYPMKPKGIYKKFKNPSNNSYLDPTIVNELFLNNLNYNQKKAMELAFGKDFLEDNLDDYPELSDKIYIIIYRFLKKLEALSVENIYEMNAQQLINLYNQKYSKGIYHMFKRKDKFLNPTIVDIIFLTNINPYIYELCQTAFLDYRENIKLCSDSQLKKRIYYNFYYQQHYIENKIECDLYESSPEKVISSYFEKFPNALINSDYLLTLPYLLDIYKNKLLKYSFYQYIYEKYNAELALIIYLYFGKELSRRLNIEEIALLLNKPLDYTANELEKVKDILRNMKEKRIVTKTRKVN